MCTFPGALLISFISTGSIAIDIRRGIGMDSGVDIGIDIRIGIGIGALVMPP